MATEFPRTAHVGNGGSVSAAISDLKAEVKSFLETRTSMLVSEFRGKLSVVKAAMPGVVVGVLFLVTVWLLITGALVAAIAVMFRENPFAIAIAFAVVGAVYALIGGLATYFAYQQFSRLEVAPSRTLRVLKEDRRWLEHEMRKS